MWLWDTSGSSRTRSHSVAVSEIVMQFFFVFFYSLRRANVAPDVLDEYSDPLVKTTPHTRPPPSAGDLRTCTNVYFAAEISPIGLHQTANAFRALERNHK